MVPHMYIYLTIMIAVWGACMGSFLNVCIYRIPREESIVKPRSHCPHCNKLIPWHLNIPILSYIMLRGRCKFCSTRFTPRYMIVEALVALLFVMTWLMFDPNAGARPFGLMTIIDIWLIPVYWLGLFGLTLGTFVDFEHMIIPNRVTLGGIAIGLILSLLVPSMHGQECAWMGLLFSLIGAVAGWGLLWGVATLGTIAFKKEAMGFGDVKLLGAIGAFLGWQGVLFTVIISSLLGATVGITLMLVGGRKLQSRIPYGPYLSLAAMIWIFWGPRLWNVYLNLMIPAQY